MPLPELDIFEKTRGLFTAVVDVRRKVLVEVARMALEGRPGHRVEDIPYAIIDRDTPTYRCCVFRERALVRERVRLALGLDLREFGAHEPIVDDAAPALVDRKVVREPLVNVIKVGCERCPTASYVVSDGCMGCMAHPCVHVCPKKAVSMKDGRSLIDRVACIRCGRCAQVCPYNAILYRERPCASACGVDAIGSDAQGFAEIDHGRCVSCGLCIVSCPFGAIAEKSEIAQVARALRSGGRIWAELAPSFVGQFGPLASPERIVAAIRALGFAGVVEVAYGAGIAIENEAAELVEIANAAGDPVRTGGRRFLGTSCCPSWVKAARRHRPELAGNIEDSFTPMVETAKRVKELDSLARVVFVGPCVAKKTECYDPRVAAWVDFVLTYEELAALFSAAGVDPSAAVAAGTPEGGAARAGAPNGIDAPASSAARAYPVSGNVSKAIVAAAERLAGKKLDLPFASADTLEDCLALIDRIAAGKDVPAILLAEGMACPGGCIGGPGTLAPLGRAKAAVAAFAAAAGPDWGKEAKPANPVPGSP